MSKKGVYIRVNGLLSKVSEFKHSTDHNFTKAHNKVAPEGKVYLVKCKDCGNMSFTDDGRYCNEFSCECCLESYTEVYFDNSGE